MVLVPGKLGIKKIESENGDGERQAISIHKGMNFGSAATLLLKGEQIYIGYNEIIYCESEESAMDLFIILDGVLSVGEKVEEVVTRAQEVIETIFMQETV